MKTDCIRPEVAVNTILVQHIGVGGCHIFYKVIKRSKTRLTVQRLAPEFFNCNIKHQTAEILPSDRLTEDIKTISISEHKIGPTKFLYEWEVWNGKPFLYYSQ